MRQPWLFLKSSLIRSFLSTSASGIRSNNTGNIGNTGVYGQYWASSAISNGSIHSSILNLYATKTETIVIGNRGLTRSVRCIQEDIIN